MDTASTGPAKHQNEYWTGGQALHPLRNGNARYHEVRLVGKVNAAALHARLGFLLPGPITLCSAPATSSMPTPGKTVDDKTMTSFMQLDCIYVQIVSFAKWQMTSVVRLIVNELLVYSAVISKRAVSDVLAASVASSISQTRKVCY
eukprot:scpid48238/ scgid34144/ 